MAASYFTKTRTNIENFVIEDASGGEQEIIITLLGYSAPTEGESDQDVTSLRIKVDERDVYIEAVDLAHLLHPLIEALRLLLAAQTVNEDELRDMWTAAR
jgi:hypothetical protein